MRWTVEGADKKSGKEKVVQIEAGSKAEAERAAVKMGILVSDIHQPVNLTAAEKLDDMVGDLIGPADAVGALVASPVESIPYRNPQGWAPEYAGITKGAKLLKQNASMYRLLAWIVVGIAVIMVAAVLATNGAAAAVVEAIFGGVGACLVAGFLMNRATMIDLTAELALAQRDIARNSFGR